MFNSLFSFYRSKEWKSLCEQLMLERLNENGEIICEHCGKPITVAYDCIRHHKTPLTELNVNDYNISLNKDNIALVHHRCHNEIHKRFGTYTRHIYIVYGSPCAGKASFVNNSVSPGDLIVDIDRIYECINNDRSNKLYSNVIEIYRQLIDMIKTRNGRWNNAWIIRGFPLKMDRERLANELGAELVFVDTPKELCVHRAYERGGNEYVKLVNDWFLKYQA